MKFSMKKDCSKLLLTELADKIGISRTMSYRNVDELIAMVIRDDLDVSLTHPDNEIIYIMMINIPITRKLLLILLI